MKGVLAEIHRQGTKRVRVVRFILLHQTQQLLGKRQIALFLVEQTQLRPHARQPMAIVQLAESVNHFFGQLDGFLLVVIQQRQQRFSQSGQIPCRDVRLVAISIAAASIDRAEYGSRIVCVYICAWTVIDRFAAYRHIVRIHHAVNKAD